MRTDREAGATGCPGRSASRIPDRTRCCAVLEGHADPDWTPGPGTGHGGRRVWLPKGPPGGTRGIAGDESVGSGAARAPPHGCDRGARRNDAEGPWLAREARPADVRATAIAWLARARPRGRPGSSAGSAGLRVDPEQGRTSSGRAQNEGLNRSEGLLPWAVPSAPIIDIMSLRTGKGWSRGHPALGKRSPGRRSTLPQHHHLRVCPRGRPRASAGDLARSPGQCRWDP